MVTRVFFLLNTLVEFNFGEFLARHLSEYQVSLGTELPPHPEDYRLIILWSYRRILREIPATNNVILFHSSDLPDGKGWAPIYHAIADGHASYVISGVFAAPQVDSGNVIVKARFGIRPEHTAAALRRFDEEISIMLVAKILQTYKSTEVVGMPQSGHESFRLRRRPESNEIDVDKTFRELIPHLRACEERSPAYFLLQGCRYLVSVRPDREPTFPQDLEISFPGLVASRNGLDRGSVVP
jgi:methionyl-tRNA formyltransferase